MMARHFTKETPAFAIPAAGVFFHFRVMTRPYGNRVGFTSERRQRHGSPGLLAGVFLRGMGQHERVDFFLPGYGTQLQ